MPTINLTEANIFIAVRSVLGGYGMISLDQAQIPIIRGMANRVPEPRESDFLVMWPLGRNRLATNTDDFQDTTVQGSITDNILNVSSISSGSITTGLLVSKSSAPSASGVILSQRDGVDGGVGNYLVSSMPDLKSQLLYVGLNSILLPTEVIIQCDVHGPSSGDNVQKLFTLFRDWFTVSAFLDQGLDITPLYADDPHQMPFINGEQQFEERWVCDLHLQINPIVTVAQQFADRLQIKTIEAETGATALGEQAGPV